MKAQREPHRLPEGQSGIHSIHGAVDQSRPLPANVDIERFVLAAVLIDDSQLAEIEVLNAGDFSLEWHRRIFQAIRNLQGKGEHIDHALVAEELGRRAELGSDGLSKLIDLQEGIPRVPHLASYVRIIQEKSARRQTILVAQQLAEDCGQQSQGLDGILSRHQSKIGIVCRSHTEAGSIRRVEDLDSVFANRGPVEYLIKPVLPAKAITCLVGASESGKSTVACAFARDVHQRGHAVLILDRDKNPRERICDRLERLGIQSDYDHFYVWDCEQDSEVPQPDDAIVIDWVKRMVTGTGKSPLVIVDSLVCFFEANEDENSARDMRAVFNRFRSLVRLGATVLPLHHLNRAGVTRGSTDFTAAADQEFLVTNKNRQGSRLLDLITLECQKSRYNPPKFIKYQYDGGKIVPLERADHAPTGDALVELLRTTPGVTGQGFENLAKQRKMSRAKARAFLKDGERSGTIRIERQGRKEMHYWLGADEDITAMPTSDATAH